MKKIILLLLLASSPALAAQERGNGGDVIVCSDGKNTFYDLYEMQQRHKIIPIIPEGASWQEITGTWISRLKKINPSRFVRFEKRLGSFLEDAEFLHGVQLIDIPDSGVGFIPRGCELRQLAVQREPKFPNDKRYLIDQELWDSLDQTNRAVLVLHELILGDAIADDQSTSESSRYLNALIIGDRLEGITTKAYIELLKKLDFTTADYNNVAISFYYQPPRNSSFNRVGRSEALVWLNGSDILLSAAQPAFVYIDNGGIKGHADCGAISGRLEFFPSGILKRIDTYGCSNNTLRFNYSGKVKIAGTLVEIESTNTERPGRRISFGDSPTEISSAIARINYGGTKGRGTVSIFEDGSSGRYDFSVGEYGQKPEQCQTIGEVFYRKRWMKVSGFSFDGASVAGVNLCPAANVKVGNQNLPVSQIREDQQRIEYELAKQTLFSFANTRLSISEITTNEGRVEAAALARKTTVTSPSGVKYTCNQGTSFSVSEGAVNFQAFYNTCDPS